MTVVHDLSIIVLVAFGAILIAIACLGLLRMPDLYTRLHAASKAATLGTASLALALVVHFADPSVVFRASALAVIVFATAPLSAHLIARAGFVSDTPRPEPYVIDESDPPSESPPDGHG